MNRRKEYSDIINVTLYLTGLTRKTVTQCVTTNCAIEEASKWNCRTTGDWATIFWHVRS